MTPRAAPARVDGSALARAAASAGIAIGVYAGAAVTAWLWWHSTPDVSGAGGWLSGAGQVCGLEAGYAVVILVLLMARVPPLEGGIGADRLARWHAAGGRYVVGLASAHALLIVWGYAVEAHTNPVTETGTLLTGYPDVLMATVAWFALLGTGLVSARAIRRRLRYETWYYLHLYTYLAIALAFSHQFADGAAFVTDAAARFWWSALYIAVAAAVAWYRIAVPARAFARHGFRVAGVRRESPRAVSIYIRGRRLRELEAAPGQFFRWRFLTRDLWWQSHPYSLSAVPSDDLMRITAIDTEGRFAALRPGARVIAEGPFGAFVPSRSGRPALLLAGGAGIAPLRAMFASLPGEVTLVYRASSEADLVFRPELDAIATARNATVLYVTGARADLTVLPQPTSPDRPPALPQPTSPDRPPALPQPAGPDRPPALPQPAGPGRPPVLSQSGDPLTADGLRRLVPGVAGMDAYVCGPPGMTDAAVTALAGAGVPRRRIRFESFEF